MENVGIFYDRLEYFIAICYILWQSGIVWAFGHFSHFGMFGPRKIWQPCFIVANLTRSDRIK
jgi:hypothetical protein